jgi:SAM-dependent methyltransferase
MHILDVGCVEHNLENRKRGHWLHEKLINQASSVLGLDYEENEIAQMIREGYNAVAGDATKFSLSKTFDAIVAGELIEHVLNPGLFLECASKHLDRKGVLILTMPNANCLSYFLENLLLGHEIDNPDHVALYSPITITYLLKKCGFVVDGIVFLAENTAYCHQSLVCKMLVFIKQAIQLALGFIRPSMCHHMIVIAHRKE